MAICFLCKKKVSSWDVYMNGDNDYCSDCWKNRKSEILKGKELEEECKKKHIEEEQKKIEEEKNTIREYKRKCNQCGKIWHSLVNREKEISRKSFWGSIVSVGTALTGELGTSTQSQRNVDAQTEQLDNLKRCPNCGSSDYTEKIIIIKK